MGYFRATHSFFFYSNMIDWLIDWLTSNLIKLSCFLYLFYHSYSWWYTNIYQHPVKIMFHSSLSIQSFTIQINVMTNWTTALSVCSVLVLVGTSQTGRLKNVWRVRWGPYVVATICLLCNRQGAWHPSKSLSTMVHGQAFRVIAWQHTSTSNSL